MIKHLHKSSMKVLLKHLHKSTISGMVEPCLGIGSMPSSFHCKHQPGFLLHRLCAQTAADHPKYSEMIRMALTKLKERGGSSRQAILKYMYILTNFCVVDQMALLWCQERHPPRGPAASTSVPQSSTRQEEEQEAERTLSPRR